jgi:hypothetical protein
LITIIINPCKKRGQNARFFVMLRETPPIQGLSAGRTNGAAAAAPLRVPHDRPLQKGLE